MCCLCLQSVAVSPITAGMSDMIAFDSVVDAVYQEHQVQYPRPDWQFPQGPELRTLAHSLTEQLHADGIRVVQAAEAQDVPQDATRKKISQITPQLQGWAIDMSVLPTRHQPKQLVGSVLQADGRLMQTDRIPLLPYEQREAASYIRQDWLRVLARNQELLVVEPVSLPDFEYQRRRLAKFVVMNDLVLPDAS